MTGLLLLILGGLGAAAWWHMLTGREFARAAAGQVCATHGLHLMDDTVVLDQVKLLRDSKPGRMGLIYRFEFVRDGVRHAGGNVLVRGTRLATVIIPVRNGQVIEEVRSGAAGG